MILCYCSHFLEMLRNACRPFVLQKQRAFCLEAQEAMQELRSWYGLLAPADLRLRCLRILLRNAAYTDHRANLFKGFASVCQGFCQLVRLLNLGIGTFSSGLRLM